MQVSEAAVCLCLLRTWVVSFTAARPSAGQVVLLVRTRSGSSSGRSNETSELTLPKTLHFRVQGLRRMHPASLSCAEPSDKVHWPTSESELG